MASRSTADAATSVRPGAATRAWTASRATVGAGAGRGRPPRVAAVQGDDDHRRAAQGGGEPAEKTRLRLVDVDDREPLRADQADQAGENSGVTGGRDLAAELRDAHRA